MLIGKTRRSGRRRRVVRVFFVETESAIEADRAVAWWARCQGVEDLRILRKQFYWLRPEMRRKRWVRLPVVDPEAWATRREATL